MSNKPSTFSTAFTSPALAREAASPLLMDGENASTSGEVSITKQLTVVSLFSGAMGLDIGLEQTGKFKLLACVEKVPAFCQTTLLNKQKGRINNPRLRVYEGDIEKLSPQRLMDDLGLKVGELDLLVGGPPCQSFSTTGRRGTVQDPRGTLLWQFLHFIEELQPKFFLMENVRGLMSAALRHRHLVSRPENGGHSLQPDEMPGSVVQAFVDDLHGSYRLDCFEVNAVNYGAPQLRERALFIGNRFNIVVDFPTPTHGLPVESPEPHLFSDDSRLLPHRTLGDALKGLSEHQPEVMDFSPRKKGFLSLVPPGGNWRCLPPEIAKESMGRAYLAKGGRSGWWRKLSFELPCPTLITMPNHAGTSLCHPVELRALSVREYARIQEFPDDWEFCGTTAEKYTQIGNAVPVRLGRVSGELLADHLSQLYKRKLKPSPGNNLSFRRVYIDSHVRTRQWYKRGKTFVWHDEPAKREYLAQR
jgi:DNA (cytosine-5)-methyltransferase 1